MSFFGVVIVLSSWNPLSKILDPPLLYDSNCAPPSLPLPFETLDLSLTWLKHHQSNLILKNQQHLREIFLELVILKASKHLQSVVLTTMRCLWPHKLATQSNNSFLTGTAIVLLVRFRFEWGNVVDLTMYIWDPIVPNCTFGKIKLTPPAYSHTTVLAISSQPKLWSTHSRMIVAGVNSWWCERLKWRLQALASVWAGYIQCCCLF